MVTGMPGGDANATGTTFTDVRWVAETGSTNADVLALARHGEPEGVVVVADHQTAGRGRRSRTWDAPPGASLLFSVLLRPPAAVAGLATMALGVAGVEAVVAAGAPGARLKWPNDLIVAERKLAGILAEADWPAGAGTADGWRSPTPTERVAVVVGMGLNVRWPSPSSPAYPDHLAGGAVALSELRPEVSFDRAGLVHDILGRLGDHYRRLVAEGPEPLLAAWRSHAATIGRRVRVDLGAEDLEGTAVDVTEEGHLVLETVDGTRRVLAVGDVVHLRPIA